MMILVHKTCTCIIYVCLYLNSYVYVLLFINVVLLVERSHFGVCVCVCVCVVPRNIISMGRERVFFSYHYCISYE